MPCVICDFHLIRPRHEVGQENILDWVAEAHARAECREEKESIGAVHNQMRARLAKLGVGKGVIDRRGMQVSDLLETDWSQMEIYPIESAPLGRGFTERSRFFDRETSKLFEQFYPIGSPLPGHLIHVTCTGYVAPSPAQKIVSLRGAGGHTTVTHAYHMGCYGSIPAIRMAQGFSASSQVDIVHTELCTLHMHPLEHATEQLIVQSLFADGFIKYTVHCGALEQKHLKILSVHEEIIPDSEGCMTWCCGDKGLVMTLSKEVPVKIARAIGGYLERLCQRAGISMEKLLREAYFAIHPGGPKILQQMRERLRLEMDQIAHSVETLRLCGNMSSATLPHIWDKMLEDPSVPKRSLIVSMAFGPGLTIAGALFEKGG